MLFTLNTKTREVFRKLTRFFPGMADIIGRRIRSPKLPHNKNKSVAGSVAMATFGFLVSIG